MFYQYKEVTLHYEEVGEGKPVLLIHGLGCDMELMKGCMERVFADLKSYRRIYLDLPGMGDSNAPLDFASADSIVEVLSAFVTEKVGENFLLAGQSYGGYLCRGLLEKHRDEVDGLMLICPVVIPETEDRDLPKKSLLFQDKTYLRELSEGKRRAFCEYAVIADERTHRRYEEEILVGLRVAKEEFIEMLRQNYRFSKDVDRLIAETGFHGPSLFLCGRQDHCTGYQDVWKLMEDYPRASFAVLDVAGHHLHIEQVEAFESLTLNWLDRVNASAGRTGR